MRPSSAEVGAAMPAGAPLVTATGAPASFCGSLMWPESALPGRSVPPPAGGPCARSSMSSIARCGSGGDAGDAARRVQFTLCAHEGGPEGRPVGVPELSDANRRALLLEHVG